MSVYGELLRMSLDTEGSRRDRTVAELVSRTLEQKAALRGSVRSVTDGGANAAPEERLSFELSYDVCLVQLCERLGLDHELLGPMAGPRARRDAEERLAEQMPELTSLTTERMSG